MKYATTDWKNRLTQAMPKPLSARQYEKERKRFEGLPSCETLARCFGSWNEALLYYYGETLIQEKNHQAISDKQLLEWKELILRYFPNPVSYNQYLVKRKTYHFLPSPHYLKRFMGGSWSEVIRFIYGEQAQLSQNQWTKESILTCVKELCQEQGHFLSVTEYDQLQQVRVNYPSPTTITRHFGSYGEMMIVLGQEDYKGVKQWAEESVYQALEAYFNQTDYVIKAKEYEEYRKSSPLQLPSLKIIAKYYGTWSSMLATFNQEVVSHRSSKWSEADIQQSLSQAAAQMGLPLTMKKYAMFRQLSDVSHPSRQAILTAYANWNEALESANIQVFKQRDIQAQFHATSGEGLKLKAYLSWCLE